MAVDDKRNPLEYCPTHSAEKLLTVRDVEFRMYFSIADEMMFCCPLLSCDYVHIGIHDRIFSQMEFVQMIMFARQKAALKKLVAYVQTIPPNYPPGFHHILDVGHGVDKTGRRVEEDKWSKPAPQKLPPIWGW